MKKNRDMKLKIFTLINILSASLLTACHGDLDIAQKSEITSYAYPHFPG